MRCRCSSGWDRTGNRFCRVLGADRASRHLCVATAMESPQMNQSSTWIRRNDFMSLIRVHGPGSRSRASAKRSEMITRTLKMTLMGVIVVSVLFVLSGRSGEACGPFFLDAIFSYLKHPDIPLDKFVQGQIGVVKASYARSYLFAAYRQMQGVTFDAGEQRALQDLWKERLDLSWEAPEDEWVKPWLDARGKVPGAGPAPKISLYRNREKPNEYESYLNCQQDAFATAAATLNERMTKFS